MSSAGQANRKKPSIARWVVLALIIHAQLAGMVGIALYFWAPRQAEVEAKRRAAGARGEPIAVSTVDDDTARKIIADLERQEEKAKLAEQKKEEESTKAPGQVVDLPRPRQERRPDEARFAAEYDSWVERETKRYGKFDPDAVQRRAGATESDKRNQPALSPNPSEVPASPGPLAMRTPAEERRLAPRRPRASDALTRAETPGSEDDLPSDPEGAFSASGGAAAARPSPRERAEQESGGRPGLYGLLPTEEQIARAVGSGTQDHLADIEEGNETALNTKRWKYATFFNRVKEKVRDHWKPAEEYQRRDPTGRIYGAEDRYTLLKVSLKADGSLANLSVAHTCGLDFLDDTALTAFKEAQPFLNVPRALVEGNGLVVFDFGFFFEVSGAPRLKLFRYRSM
jgi:outer membrane biosynthesis protein TonB